MTDTLAADFSARIAVDSGSIGWEPGPSPLIWRRRLHVAGPAATGRATTVVRYDPGATFPRHDHIPTGEEIIVLDGTLEDEAGVYPALTYMGNPNGFLHAPRAPKGCSFFVRLRQYAPKTRVVAHPDQGTWETREAPSVEYLPLYEHEGHKAQFERWRPGAVAPRHVHSDMIEIFVLDGEFSDEFGTYRKGAWLRYPVGSSHTPRSDKGCLFYATSGPVPAIADKAA